MIDHPAVREALPHATGHLFEVTAHPAAGPAFDLPAEAVSVSFDDSWAPYVQSQIDVPVPTDQGQLDALDPRKNCRIKILLGYRLPDGTEHWADKPLDLGLRRRPVRRPGNTMTLEADSDEARAQDYKIFNGAGFIKSGLAPLLRYVLQWVMRPEGTPTVSNPFGDADGAADLVDMVTDLGESYWTLIDDAAARAGRRVYCDEYRIWRIANRPDKAGTPVHAVTVGQNGTLISSSSDLSRDEWYNAVLLRYKWSTDTDGARREYVRYGRAQISTGDFTEEKVGRKAYFQELPRPVGQATADKTAAVKLRHLVTRGRNLQLEAAAAYWIRPGDTVAVTLPTGPEELHLVRAVSFKPAAGTMQLTTRLPENVQIKTGE